MEFQPGKTVATVTLTLIDDAIDEEDETLSLALTGATNVQMSPGLGLGRHRRRS